MKTKQPQSSEFDLVLRKMLETPPQPKQPKAAKKAAPAKKRGFKQR